MRQLRSAGSQAARIKFGVCALGLFTSIFALASGCGGSNDGVSDAKLPKGVRAQGVEHESCDESGHKVETVDVNGDGKPDIRRVYDGTQEVCRISDLNRDGKPDLFEYYDKTGQLRRREADYDDNGIVNAIELYENGKLVRAEFDTTNQGRIDTWDTFDPATGKRLKRERDATGDGRIDQWWTYNGDQTTIALDKNGDGNPDPEATMTLGGSGAPVPATAADAGAPVPSAPVASAAPSASAPASAQTGEVSPSGPDAGATGPAKRGGAKR